MTPFEGNPKDFEAPAYTPRVAPAPPKRLKEGDDFETRLDVAMRAMIQQAEPCVAEGRCRYTHAHLHCIVGHMLTYYERGNIMRQRRNSVSIEGLASLRLLPRCMTPHVELLIDLQGSHDQPAQINESSQGSYLANFIHGAESVFRELGYDWNPEWTTLANARVKELRAEEAQRHRDWNF